MLTPIEIQSKTFKTGFGFDKKEVEAFIKEIVKDYEVLYKDNMELHDKINVLSEGVQYYKSIEKTLQKALVLAQKAAQETEANATEKAENIVNNATNKAITIETTAEQKAKQIKESAMEHADSVLTKARQELDRIQIDVANLMQQYDKYKIQYKQLINTQMEILDSPAYNVDYSDFVTFHSFISSKVEMPKEETVETEKADVAEAKAEEVVNEEPVKEEQAVIEEEPVVHEEAVVNEEPVVEEEHVEEKQPEIKPSVMDDDFIPTLDLKGILDDVELEEDPVDVKSDESVVSDHIMKELTADSEKAEEHAESLDDTMNQLSEKELLMKLFSNVNESTLKPHKSGKKDDFEFLDL